MRFPSPYLPKSPHNWPIKWRQRFARYYWNPWWKVKNFFEKWVSVYGLLMFMDRISFKYLCWSQGIEDWLSSKGKGWK